MLGCPASATLSLWYNDEKTIEGRVCMESKKITIVILLIACIFTSVPQQALAVPAYRYEAEAWQLYRLGVFAGASKDRFNPDLGAILDRQTGITLLLNFFGKTPEADKLSSSEIEMILSKYSDRGLILPWARKYMAYAVKTGVIVGTSETTLGPKDPLDGLAFAAMILRQTGFIVGREDYINSIRTLCIRAGLKQTDIDYFNKKQLIKDDAVGMVYAALFAECSNGKDLICNFIDTGIVSMETAVALGIVSYNAPGSVDPDVGTYNPPERPAGYQQAYFQIYDALAGAVDSIWLIRNEYTDTFEEITDIVSTCVRENPEILYYTGISYNSSGLLTFKYSKDKKTIMDHKSELVKKVDAILKEIIKPGMTDYQKEKAIHDYLVMNCEYDIDGFNSNKIRAESFNAYGALCLGIAVCEGYAEAAQLLLTRSGVESMIITGESRGYAHAWNLVRLDGQYYHLDITWDDTLQNSGNNGIRYYYFNLDDKRISRDHQWVRADYPACSSGKYEYYTYNNLAVKNQDEFIDRVIEEVQKGNKEVTLKIQDAEGFNINRAIDAIINQLYLGCSYLYNKEHGVATVKF